MAVSLYCYDIFRIVMIICCLFFDFFICFQRFFPPVFSAQYSLAVVAPQKDIDVSVNKFNSNLLKLQIIQLAIFISVIIFTSVVLYFLVTRLSARIVVPVQELTILCQQIARFVRCVSNRDERELGAGGKGSTKGKKKRSLIVRSFFAEATWKRT